MATEILMPKLGFSEGDVQVSKWLKGKGDSITKGEPVVEVMGDKITSEIDAPATGLLQVIAVPEGLTVPIGTVLAIIGEPGENIQEPVGSVGSPEPPPKATDAIQQPAPPNVAGDKEVVIKASPVARRIAKENNVDLAQVAATLPPGKRMQGEDVEAFLQNKGECTSPAEVANFQAVKLAGMRKAIAERMALSSREMAAVTMMRSVDATRLRELRYQLKADLASSGTRAPSINDFVMKAVALALQEHPNLNATFVDEEIRVYQDINLSFAVALEQGLITPVIQNVAAKSVREISSETAELANKARMGQLEGKDLRDGTFTVTNLGMYDIEVSTPVINPPQVAILAVGTIKPYLVLENEQVMERFRLDLSLTVDHRIVDGAPGALFLQTVASYLETPYRLLS